MTRWFWKRCLLAGFCSTALFAGVSAAQRNGNPAPPAPPKVGDVITLPFADGSNKRVKVIKIERLPDGSLLSEVQDTKTGESFPLLDRPNEYNQPGTSGSEPARANSSKNSTRSSDPLLPNMSGSKEQPKEQKKERRLFGNFSLFSSRSNSPEMPETAKPQEEERPGFLKRLFGRKSSATKSTGSSTSAKSDMPAFVPGTMAAPAMPPAIRSVPVTTFPPTRGTSSAPLLPGISPEPPRSRPIEPLNPPTPVFPTPRTPPTSTPAPLPFPSTPVTPAVPSVPTIPPASTPVPGGLPSIPVPPGGLSSAKSAVIQAGHTSTVDMMAGMSAETRQHALTMTSAVAPSQRALAARSLSRCGEGSSVAVKSFLLNSAKCDPCGMVRAVCIEELCKLGCKDAEFVAFLKKACTDSSSDVCTAAKDAMAKMSEKK